MMKMLCFTVMVILALTLVAEAQFSITIDAQKDAWYEGLTNPADGLVYLPARSYLRDINTTGGPDDDADLSAMVWMAWDDTYFYLYEEVKDDSIAVNNSTRYQNDCNEMKFDPDPSVGGATISSPNSRLTAYDSDLAQTPAGVDNLNDDGGLVDASGTAWVATTDDYARAVTDDGYILEFRIPWEFINHNASDRHMTVSVGEKFGMAMNLIDNDGIQRDNMLQWSAGHHDQVWNNNHLLGAVTFLEGNKLGLEAVSATFPDSIVNKNEYFWYYPFSIAIDAQKDPWYDGLTNPEDGMIYLPARSFLRDINASGPEGGDEDISAIVWMAWDETYLYVYDEVKDDNIQVSNSTNWENDCIELKFDPDPSILGTTGTAEMRLSAYDVDMAQEPAGVDNINVDQRLWDVDGNNFVPTEDDYARDETDDGYILEFRIPWEFVNSDPVYGRLIFVGEGEIFGMAINQADNDGTNRDNMLQWSAGHADAAWSNPSLHGTVTYLAGNVLGFEAVSAQDPAIFNDSSLVWYYPPVVAIEPVKIGNAPETFSLLQNYPNPFNPLTTIEYNLNRKETVTLSIYNVTGQLVRNLLSNRSHLPGSYRVVWDGTNDMGQRVASGIYFYQIRTSSTAMTNKMLLAR